MLVPQFKMWIGVVEDRIDPEQLGRYRVRILGYHTANRESLPTEMLPWAVPVMPVTGTSVSGVGETPNLTNGSTVIGFFVDGDDEQQPIILGSMPGLPTEKVEDNKVGFNDPKHIYPFTTKEGRNGLKESDLSRLARGAEAEKHASLIKKRGARINEVPTARAPDVSSTSPNIAGASYENGTWAEPHARWGTTADGTYSEPGTVPTFENGTTSVYPYNHVKETESGHIFEVDDTPLNGRIHEYHNSGTYREIQSDGTRVTKVVSRDVEIVLAGKDVYITGGCNVTIKGDCKMLVEGDKYEEIRGNQFTIVEKNRHTKVIGTDVLECHSNVGYNIGNEDGQGDFIVSAAHDISFTAQGRGQFTSGGQMNVGAGKSITLTGGSSIQCNAGTSVKVAGPLGVDIDSSGYGIPGFGHVKVHSNGSMDLIAGTAQKISAGTGNQLLEAGAMQTISAVGPQLFMAPVRQITTPVTNHQGLYNVAGPVFGQGVTSSIGMISMNTHKHTVISIGAPTGLPVLP